MKIIKLIFIYAVLCACIVSCDDNTDGIGMSIVDNLDNLNVTCDTFSVASRTVESGPVYSRSTIGYLGKVKDPETNSNVKGNFTTQFYTLEGTQLPEESSIESKLKNGTVIADSCIIYLYYDNYFGDSLSTMKVKAMELAKPMEEGGKYYSDFDPEELCRKDKGAVNVNKTYSLYDLAADTVQKKIRIKLPNSAIGEDGNIRGDYAYYKDGKGYYNYGSYLMQKYYDNHDNYKNAYTFIHKVCPGFYFKSIDGIGAMAYINMSQMLVYYKYKYEKETDGVKKDTTVNVVTTFAGTEEVIQSSKIAGDYGNLDILSNKYTYEKSPAGLYTELTIPVDDITEGHKNDSINSANIALAKVNNISKEKYCFDSPSTLLMIPKDSLKNFFEEGKLPDNKVSYIATYSQTSSTVGTATNAYTFHNIADLINYMRKTRYSKIGEEPTEKTSVEWTTWNSKRENWERENPDWNKVYVVPVSTTYETINSRQQLAKVENDMSMTSTRIVRGDGIMPTGNKDDIKLKLFVIYSKFEKK